MSNENWCFRKHLYNFKVPLGHRENNFAKFDQNDVVVPTYAGETWWFFSYVVTGYILKKRIMPHLKVDLCVTEINLVYNELELPL